MLGNRFGGLPVEGCGRELLEDGKSSGIVVDESCAGAGVCEEARKAGGRTGFKKARGLDGREETQCLAHGLWVSMARIGDVVLDLRWGGH